MKLTRFPFPLNTDAWDGYPAARARVLASMRAARRQRASCSPATTHTAWANELNDAQGRVGVEFGTTSITSPSDASYFTPFGIDFAAGVRARNPHVKWTDAASAASCVLTLTPEQATAEFFAVSTVTSKTYETRASPRSRSRRMRARGWAQLQKRRTNPPLGPREGEGP